MMKFVVTVFMSILGISSSQLVGSQQDDHNCVTDGGYRWCESLNRCVRPWETPCSDIAVDPLPPPPSAPPSAPPTPPPSPAPTVIPNTCSSWYDGCNHCQVRDGQMIGCTRMMCIRQGTPRCLTYNTLNIGDICYRFCEDSSEPAINHMNDCPNLSVCRGPSNPSFDSCHGNAWRCLAGH